MALEFGRPIYELNSMPEREFARWQRHAERRGLPSRRIELYLAQIAWIVAQTAGAKETTLADFLFDEAVEEPMDEVDELEAAKAAFDFRPRNKKEG